MQCPPVPAAPSIFDVRNANSCVDMLQSLLDAYNMVLTGNQRVIVRNQDRWTEFQKSNVEMLRQQYQTIYSQCPAARAAGLPSLNQGLIARRGPPARGFTGFGRL